MKKYIRRKKTNIANEILFNGTEVNTKKIANNCDAKEMFTMTTKITVICIN